MIKVGDVVRLKGGGPQMTVYHLSKAVDPRGVVQIVGVICAWFDGREENLHTGEFSLEALVSEEVK